MKKEVLLLIACYIAVFAMDMLAVFLILLLAHLAFPVTVTVGKVVVGAGILFLLQFIILLIGIGKHFGNWD